MSYCTNCGKQLSDTANFCPYCGTKVLRNSNPGQPNNSGYTGSNPGATQPTPQVASQPTTSGKSRSVKVSNFLIPILIMFGGGWICSLFTDALMPNESLVHTATLVYVALSGFYIFLCYSSLESKHSDAAGTRSIIVAISGAIIVVLAFFTYASDSVSMALLLFFLCLIIMIIDSILDTTAPDWD